MQSVSVKRYVCIYEYIVSYFNIYSCYISMGVRVCVCLYIHAYGIGVGYLCTCTCVRTSYTHKEMVPSGRCSDSHAPANAQVGRKWHVSGAPAEQCHVHARGRHRWRSSRDTADVPGEPSLQRSKVPK